VKLPPSKKSWIESLKKLSALQVTNKAAQLKTALVSDGSWLSRLPSWNKSWASKKELNLRLQLSNLTLIKLFRRHSSTPSLWQQTPCSCRRFYSNFVELVGVSLEGEPKKKTKFWMAPTKSSGESKSCHSSPACSKGFLRMAQVSSQVSLPLNKLIRQILS